MGTEKLFDIREELKKLPDHPGVYIMHDDRDAIIYIGKAISLKNRVRQYFQTSRNKGPKIEKMVTHIDHFEYILTDSELEALVLECNLIKEHRPKYNTMLKDDKTYPYIKVTLGEAYPRVLFSRQMKKDKSKYYGPYTSAGAVKDTIELVQKLFQIRTCNRTLPRDIGKERPCLNYHIHQCQAPCQGYISKEDYRTQIRSAMELLNGNFNPVIRDLEEKLEKGIVQTIPAKGGSSPQQSTAQPEPQAPLPEAVPEDIRMVAGKWSAAISELPNPMKTYLKGAYPSLSEDGKLMVVLGDGLPFDYFRQEGHKEELEKHLSGYAGKAMEVVIKNAQAGRNPEAVFPNLTRLISDNIQIEIEEEEEPEEDPLEEEF